MVWDKVVAVFQAWKEGTISGAPKKRPIKQTTFMVLPDVPEDKRANLLDQLLGGSLLYKEFIVACNAAAGKE